jgi:hypothetical protein
LKVSKRSWAVQAWWGSMAPALHCHGDWMWRRDAFLPAFGSFWLMRLIWTMLLRLSLNSVRHFFMSLGPKQADANKSGSNKSFRYMDYFHLSLVWHKLNSAFRISQKTAPIFPIWYFSGFSFIHSPGFPNLIRWRPSYLRRIMLNLPEYHIFIWEIGLQKGFWWAGLPNMFSL